MFPISLNGYIYGNDFIYPGGLQTFIQARNEPIQCMEFIPSAGGIAEVRRYEHRLILNMLF
jgi:hypothetical protein